MEKTMTPFKKMTGPQVDKWLDLLRARLRKAKSIPSDVVQEVLEQEGCEMMDEFEVNLRRRVEARINRDSAFILVVEFSLIVPERYSGRTLNPTSLMV